MLLKLFLHATVVVAILVTGLFLTCNPVWAQNTFVYGNNDAPTNSVSAFLVGANGTLTPVPGSPFPTGGNGNTTGFFATNRANTTLTGNFLYVTNNASGTVSGFSINPTTGVLTAVPGSPFPFAPNTQGSFSVVTTPDGRFLYVGNDTNQNITRFSINPATGQLTLLGTIPVSGGINGTKITRDGRFFAVALTFSRQIAMFAVNPMTGDLTPVPGSPFTPNIIPIDSNGLTSVEINAAGTLLFASVSNSTNTTISVLQIAANGALTEIAGSPFSFASGVNSNVATLSPDERFLYVSNQISNTVTSLAVAPNGALSLVPGSPVGVGAVTPCGIATNRAGTLLFTANLNANISVLSINPATGVVTNNVPGSPFSNGTSFGMLSLAVFPAGGGSSITTGLGQVYAADTSNNRVQVFNGSSWSLAPGSSGVIGSGPGQFRSPEAVTATADGKIFVADTGNNRIHWFNGVGWSDFASPGGGLNQVIAPQGVALAPSGGFLFVADTGNNRILRFSATSPGSPGTVLATFGSGPGQVRSPRGLTVDLNGNLFIADTGNNQVLRIANATTTTTVNAGSPVASLGLATAPAQVRAPEGVAVDDAGNLYIADTGNNRVLLLVGGLPGAATVLTTPGSAFGQTLAPEGVTVSALPTGAAIVVSDTGNNRIQTRPVAGGAWVAASGVLGQTGTLGVGIGQFRSPSKIR